MSHRRPAFGPAGLEWLFLHRFSFVKPTEPGRGKRGHAIAMQLCTLSPIGRTGRGALAVILLAVLCISNSRSAPAQQTNPSEQTNPTEQTNPSEPVSAAGARAVSDGSLPHLLRVAEGVLSGAQPRDEQDFARLAEMGVRTIVSVDGIRPNVEAARRHGLRYVHIPFGYDGVDEVALQQLSRVAREVDHPVYVHCHHGKHRGPAAAAVICLANGDFHRAEAMDYLQRAGTSPNYQGLWRSVRQYRVPPPDAVLPELVEVATVDDLVQWMAEMDRALDQLKLAEQAHWRTPTDHPDLVPAHQALLVQEALRESHRQLDADQRSAFGDAMAASERIAGELTAAIEAERSGPANQAFRRLQQSCVDCHREHR